MTAMQTAVLERLGHRQYHRYLKMATRFNDAHHTTKRSISH